MGRHFHKRSRQTLDTLYHQGYNDGRRGSPRTYHKTKRLKGAWYWCPGIYWRGYNDGLDSRTRWWLTRLRNNTLLVRIVTVIFSAIMTGGFSSLMVK